MINLNNSILSVKQFAQQNWSLSQFSVGIYDKMNGCLGKKQLENELFTF